MPSAPRSSRETTILDVLEALIAAIDEIDAHTAAAETKLAAIPWVKEAERRRELGHLQLHITHAAARARAASREGRQAVLEATRRG